MKMRGTKIKYSLLFIYLKIAIVISSPIATPYAENERLAKAQEILLYMNASVDPCEDFYEFTCGNYATYHSAAKANQKIAYMIQDMQIARDEKIIELLSKDDEETDSVIDQKVKTVYQSCLKFPTYLEKHPDAYQKLIEEIGQMPALMGDGQWSEENEFDWLKTTASIKNKYGLDIITDCIVNPEFSNNSIHAIYIGEQNLFLGSRAIYMEKEFEHLLLQYRLDVAKDLVKYLKMDKDVAKHTANEIVDFEIAMAHGHIDPRVVQRLDEIYVLTTFEELHEKYLPQWNASEQVLLTLGTIPPFKLRIHNVYQQHILKLIAETPKRTLANYIHYQFLSKLVTEFPDKKKLENVCLDALKRFLSKSFDNLLYRKSRSMQEVEQGAFDMWHSINSAFRDLLKSERLNWQSEETRKYALEKINAMELVIKSYADTDFHQELGNLQVNIENFLNNLKALRALDGDKRREAMYKPPAEPDYSHLVSLSPANVLGENKVVYPVAFLQPNYVYSKSFPNAYNYAALGSALAHECIHSMDDRGREFDAHGNIQSWWDEESSNNFVDRAKCFTQQYKQYVWRGRNLPESESQSENIADNGGVRLAYEAYLKWYNNILDSKQLKELEYFPGLTKYSPQQLYFISFSHFWCSDTNPDHVAKRVDDSHTVEKFRVIGSLSNYEEFSKAFNCPAGSGMNPAKKCEIF